MLPAPHRLRRPPEFAQAVRRGRRSGRGHLVVHLRAAPAPADGPARVGLVVGKVVGPAVVRNRVRRRLRELLPPGSVLVVRALPGAGGASFAALAADLDAALGRLRPASAGDRPR